MEKSEMVAARIDGERRSRFEAELRNSEAESESELFRELIDLGLDTRGRGLYRRLGCTDKIAALIEEEREPGESKHEVVARLLRRAVGEGDGMPGVLDDGDLRDRVEDLAEEGEPVDDAARRLLREAVEAKESANQPMYDRLLNIVAIFIISAIPIGNAISGDLYTALAWVAFYAILFEFGDEISNQFDRLKGLAGRVKA